MKYLAILALFALSSCTYTISMAHTSGTATDLIDEEQTPTATTTANASLTK